jgi:glucose-6-phosphate isomerase
MIAAHAVEKLWERRADLWTSDAEQARIIANRLGWLGIAGAMRPQSEDLAAFARAIVQEGFRDVVLLGMGGSSLAAEVFVLTFPKPAGTRRFFNLDTTDPETIRAVERSIDLRQTLFVVASKSGQTIETLSLFFYFYHRLNLAGARPPGKHFVAITDEGSYLAQLAGEYSFRETFLNPSNIGGRYSALSYFGLVPAALWGAEFDAVLDAALEMQAACSPGVSAEANRALTLAALLGAAARNALAPMGKLFLLATPRLLPLANWVEQLVAESTGKDGTGIVPVVCGNAPVADSLEEGCVLATLSLAGEKTAELDTLVASLQPRGVPVARIHLGRTAELGAAFFLWEVATALAGAVLGINPFDEPNVRENKENTSRILEQFQATGKLPSGTPRLSESGIELYAEGTLRRQLSTLRFPEAVRSFLAQRKPVDYLAVLAYLDRNDSNADCLEVLRTMLSEHLHLPVSLGYGPRYLHSTGQLFKGGPGTGMYLMITAKKSQDVHIPGTRYTFGLLQMAQALGDLEALTLRGKPALRLHLTEGTQKGLEDLRKRLAQALAGWHSPGR